MTERLVLWSQAAQRDLEAIVDYIAEQQPATALKVFERLHARTERLASQSLRGRRVPELRHLGIQSHHEIIEAEIIAAPWRIIYRPTPDRVLVVAIFDARRDIQGVLMERLLRPR